MRVFWRRSDPHRIFISSGAGWAQSTSKNVLAYVISCRRGVPPAIFGGSGLHLEDIGAKERTTKDVNPGASRVGRQTLSFDCSLHLTSSYCFGLS